MLLSALAQTKAPETAAADGQLGLYTLPSGAPGIAEGIQPDFDAFQGIFTFFRGQIPDGRRANTAAAQTEPEQVGPAEVNDDHADGGDDHSTRQVLFPHHFQSKNSQNGHKGHNTVAQGVHFFAAVDGCKTGKAQNDGDLCQLRGLEGTQTRQFDPAGGTVDGDPQALYAGDLDGSHHRHGEDQRRNGKIMQFVIVELGGNEHDHNAAHRKDTLTENKVGGIAVKVVVGRGIAGRKQADQAHSQQHHGQKQQRLVQMAALLHAFRLLCRGGGRVAPGHRDGLRRFFLSGHIGGDGKQLLSSICKRGGYASRDKAHKAAVTVQATMTIFHSLQPHSSRWWWMGAILKNRLPWVILK